jgi:serine phosphatase RsbU (regulator of sigma subunit)
VKNLPKILVVDDSKTVVSLISKLLSDDYLVLSAHSGEEAIELYKNENPSAILLDVEMPGMNGFDVCREIKSLDAHNFTPILFITSRDDISSIKEGLDSGGEGYLTKPFNEVELKARINAAIRTKNLLSELEKANAYIEKERDVIANIQRNLLPKTLPDISGFNFFSEYKPTSKAGGDYYDFIQIDDQHLGVMISDVSGHGTPAAVIMAMTRIALNTHLIKIRSPKAVLEKLNKILCENINTGDFITAFYAVIHIPTRVMTYANAGHNPALLFNPKESTVVELNVDHGFPLMIKPNNRIEEKSIQLPLSSKLIMYTDGLTEAGNNSGELFGVCKLKDSIIESGLTGDANEMGIKLIENIENFTNNIPFKDDITLLVIHVE